MSQICSVINNTATNNFWTPVWTLIIKTTTALYFRFLAILRQCLGPYLHYYERFWVGSFFSRSPSEFADETPLHSFIPPLPESSQTTCQAHVLWCLWEVCVLATSVFRILHTIFRFWRKKCFWLAAWAMSRTKSNSDLRSFSSSSGSHSDSDSSCKESLNPAETHRRRRSQIILNHGPSLNPLQPQLSSENVTNVVSRSAVRSLTRFQ